MDMYAFYVYSDYGYAGGTSDRKSTIGIAYLLEETLWHGEQETRYGVST